MFAMNTNDDNDYFNVYSWRQNTNIYFITEYKTQLTDVDMAVCTVGNMADTYYLILYAIKEVYCYFQLPSN